MGRLEKVRLAEESKKQEELNKQRADPKFYQMTEEKINKMIVDYNSDVSGHSEDEDRSAVHRKKKRKWGDQQELVKGESLTNKVDEFLKKFNENKLMDEVEVQNEVPIVNEIKSEPELDSDGHKILFGDWRILEDGEGDQYYS